MARRGSRGDRVLESRHLIGLFVGVVILCTVFFSLGYVMGKSRLSGAVEAGYAPERAAVPAIDRERVQPKEDASAPVGGWDFYANQKNNKLEKPSPPAKTLAPETPATTTAPDRAPETPPFTESRTPRATTRQVRVNASPSKMLASNITLQVAAVLHQSDALAMADALQRKKFPSFVVAPGGDSFYRVQVGPYPDERTADIAMNELDRAGFKAIIKR